MKRARRKFGLINLPISMEGMYTKYGKDYLEKIISEEVAKELN